MTWLLTAALMLGLCAGAMAQEMVSVVELYAQVQAMGGVWHETFQTPNGEMTVDAPVIVPDVRAMTVLTVEQAKISRKLFDRIRRGKRVGGRDEHMYETEMDGETVGFSWAGTTITPSASRAAAPDMMPLRSWMCITGDI